MSGDDWTLLDYFDYGAFCISVTGAYGIVDADAVERCQAFKWSSDRPKAAALAWAEQRVAERPQRRLMVLDALRAEQEAEQAITERRKRGEISHDEAFRQSLQLWAATH